MDTEEAREEAEKGVERLILAAERGGSPWVARQMEENREREIAYLIARIEEANRHDS